MAISGFLLCSIFVGTIVLCSPRTLKSQFRVEGNRPTRGFSEMKLSTSRGFGKRSDVFTTDDLITARGYGKRMDEANTFNNIPLNSYLLELLSQNLAQNRFGNLRIPKNLLQNVDYANLDE